MFEIQNYGSFILAILAFQLFPGAGTVTILNATARNGINAGMRTVFGTITGDFIYMLGAVLGLAAVLSAHPRMLAVAQWIGVFYLCWMGINFFRSKNFETPINNSQQVVNWKFFRQALAVSLTNPKAIMFFMAFFPLFLSKDSGPFILIILMLHVSVISFLYQTGLVLVGNVVALRLSKWKWSRLVISRLLGVVFIGFGVKLAINIK
ncbi:LysE family translocator [bacterium]|nr:LysE family translocator [bacterium]